MDQSKPLQPGRSLGEQESPVGVAVTVVVFSATFSVANPLMPRKTMLEVPFSEEISMLPFLPKGADQQRTVVVIHGGYVSVLNSRDPVTVSLVFHLALKQES